MISTTKDIPTPIEKWPLEINPRNRKQLITLGNYLIKFGLSESESETIKLRANLIPTLEHLNMKLLAQVWIYIKNMRISPDSTLMSLQYDQNINFEEIDTQIKSFNPKVELITTRSKKSAEEQEIYKYRFYATWLRYMQICLPYSNTYESLETTLSRVSARELGILPQQVNPPEVVYTHFTEIFPSEIYEEVNELVG